MNIFLAIICLLFGFVFLVKGADWFVDGASGIAKKLRVPTIVIGLTVVSFGTSAPELATSIISASQNSANLAVGNVVGSNITNILLILGLAAIICPLVVQKSTLRIDFFVLLGSSVLLLLFGSFDNVIGRIEGAIMFVLSLAYMVFLVWYAVRESKKESANVLSDSNVATQQDKTATSRLECWRQKMNEKTWFLVVTMLVGLALVVVGAMYGVIPGAEYIALRIGISDKIIGLTVVAIGTSLPELVTCVIAAKKGETDIAVGDIVGSNIFNIIRTLGLASIIIPLPFESSFIIDGSIALASALLLVVLGFLKGNKIRRWGGAIMLAGFILYYVYLFAFA